jgi:23S rRNA pseudouridine1911/1915/1917 synthase
MKLFQIVSGGQKLETLLTQSLNQLRQYLRAKPEQVLAQAHVYLREKKIVRHQIFVKKGTIVSILVPETMLLKPCFELTESQIAYEDNEIIVVDKPPGLPTQSTQVPGEDHLFASVIAYLTQKNPSKLAYVGLHHRLDRDTSGLVLLTKKSSANKSISDQFKERKIKKSYKALVEGEKPHPPKWKVEEPIRRLFGAKDFRFGIDHKKGDEAMTLFEWQKSIGQNYQLIECQPLTGRTHQIRIHLAHSRLPIVGDRLYGAKSHLRMQLHAYRLQFQHPKTEKMLDVKSNQSLEGESPLL